MSVFRGIVVKHVHKRLPPFRRQPRDPEGVPLQLNKFVCREVCALCHLLYVLRHVGAEVSRVVRVHRHLDSGPQEMRDLFALEILRDDRVGHGTARQANVLLLQQRHERGVFHDVCPVIYAIHLDILQHLPNVLDAVLLVDVTVHRQEESFFPGPLKHRGKLLWWIVPLIRVEANADDPVLVGKGFHERSHGVSGVHVAKDAHDE